MRRLAAVSLGWAIVLITAWRYGILATFAEAPRSTEALRPLFSHRRGLVNAINVPADVGRWAALRHVPSLPPPPPPKISLSASRKSSGNAPMPMISSPGGGVDDDAQGGGERSDIDVFGGQADLAGHRGNDQCWRHFDFGMLDAWQAAAVPFCVPDSVAPSSAGLLAAPAPLALRAAVDAAADAGVGGGSWLVCRVTVDEHLPPATAPHTLCDGANLVMRWQSMVAVPCPDSRPGYKCDGGPDFWSWPMGALAGACARTPAFVAEAFPRDHLRDLFGGFESSRDLAAGTTQSPAPVTLFVTRERGEHGNLFHATTDWMNAFFTLHVAGIIDGHTGARAGMERVQLVFLDEHVGPFEDALWAPVFSPAHAVSRVAGLREAAAAAGGAGATRFPRALFSPPGYTNMLLAHVVSEGDCHARTQLLESYRAFMLRGLGLGALVSPRGALPPPMGANDTDAVAVAEAAAGGGAGAMRPLRITFISRRPYAVAGIEHAFMGRQVDNEAALLAAAAAAVGARAVVSRADLAPLSVAAQVSLIARTDVLVGMHGAALTWAALLPPHAAVLELWPKDRDMWRCFEHLAAMAGLAYERWENAEPARFRQDASGDYTAVDESAVSDVLVRLLVGVEARVSATLRGDA